MSDGGARMGKRNRMFRGGAAVACASLIAAISACTGDDSGSGGDDGVGGGAAAEAATAAPVSALAAAVQAEAAARERENRRIRLYQFKSNILANSMIFNNSS